MLNNVISLLRPVGRCRVWVLLPLCELMLFFFQSYAPLQSVRMWCFCVLTVLNSKPFFFLIISVVPLRPLILCRVLCPCGCGKCEFELILGGRKPKHVVKIIVHKVPIHIIVFTGPDNKNWLTTCSCDTVFLIYVSNATQFLWSSHYTKTLGVLLHDPLIPSLLGRRSEKTTF